MRRWALTSWLFLTIGITLGMWSAYVEPGRGGHWAWDPVQNASLFPWLAGTAFLHSIMVQEERGTLRKWTVTLVIGTFLLAVLGTVLRRSGIEQGMPAFVTSPAGPWFAGVLLLALVVSVVLVATRLKDFEATAERERQASREAEFPHHNVLRLGITFSVLWGTLFPVLSAAVTGSTITIGPPSFNAVNILLGLALLGLTGIGPLLVWRRASVVHLRRQLVGSVTGGLATGAVLLLGGMRDPFALVAFALAGFVTGAIAQEFHKGMGARRRMYAEGALRAGARLIGRNRRRYGGYILHAGMTLVIAAFAGLAFRKEYDITLAPGERFTAKDAFGHSWSFTSDGLSRFELPNRHVVALNLATARDGRAQPHIVSEQRQHVDSRGNPTFEPSTQSGILHALRQDVHVVLAGASAGDLAEVRITFSPLVTWVWFGGMIIALGGLIVMWPQATGRRVQQGNAAPLAPEGEIVGTTAP